MKVQIIANIRDENGAYDPCYHNVPGCMCSVVDIREVTANDYIQRRLAVLWPKEEKALEQGIIETPENNLDEDRETATIKSKRNKRDAV